MSDFSDKTPEEIFDDILDAATEDINPISPVDRMVVKTQVYHQYMRIRWLCYKDEGLRAQRGKYEQKTRRVAGNH